MLGHNRAIRYPVGVGKRRHGLARPPHVALKELNPASARRRVSGAPCPVIRAGAGNPMGAATMGLDHGNSGIHGTNDPGSVGKFVSQAASACTTATSWISIAACRWNAK